MYEEATFVERVNSGLKAIQKARFTAGEVVFVIGQGPIGLLLTFLARDDGAEVLSSDPIAFRREMSVRFGAAMCFDPTGVDAAAEVRNHRGGIGAGAVFLAVADPKLVTVALNITPPLG